MHPTKPQITYLWRTLQNYGSDYEKIKNLDRETASEVIDQIQSAFKENALDPKVRYSEVEKQNALNNRTKAIRRIKTSYDI